ncbi:hypothetical protein ACOSP7_013304 [Xanthoceras sorbifolium]
MHRSFGGSLWSMVTWLAVTSRPLGDFSRSTMSSHESSNLGSEVSTYGEGRVELSSDSWEESVADGVLVTAADAREEQGVKRAL